MSARKMLVVVLNKTNAVVGVATRRSAGVPAVTDLAGSGLLLRVADQDAMIAVAADELVVKEVDYSEDVVRQPFGYVLNAGGAVIAPSVKVSGTVTTISTVSVNLSAAQPDKDVVLIIDVGSGQKPLKFTGKAGAASPVIVPVSGVAAGTHLILATVDGCAPRLEAKNFT